MNTTNVILIIIFSIISIVYLYVKYKFSYWKRKGVLHDPPKFPHGNISGLGKKYHISELTEQLYNKYKGKAKIAGLYFFISPIVVVLDIELVKQILIKDFHSFNERGIYYNEKDDPISAHLFSLDGEKWKPLRAKLSPTFTSGKMKFMFSTIIEVVDRFRNCIKDAIDKEGGTIEIKEMLACFTTDVIGSCAFGFDCDSLNNPHSEFREKGREIFTKPKYSAVITNFIRTFKEPAKKLHFKLIPDNISEFIMNIITENIAYRKVNKIQRNDFMDILIKLQDDGVMTTSEIAAQAFIFFLAGFETSSSAMAFCLFELAKQPKVQKEIRQNVRDVLKKRGGEFTYEAMLEMQLLEQAIYETLRLYPTLTSLIRVAQNDYKISGTNHVIEKGTSVFIPAYSIQRDSEYYPEPNKFQIERFSPEEVAKRGSGKWLPFGDGPRNCIGLRFGMMQARVGLAMLLDNYEFTLSDKTPYTMKFNPRINLLTSKFPIYLNLKNIK